MYDTLSMRQMILKFEKTSKSELTELEDDYEFFCGIKPIEKEVTLTELQESLDEYHLLDVREDWERAQHLSLIHI